ALEPYGRRFWPDGLLGWSRLLSGRVLDPRVGHDVLVGCALGLGLIGIDVGVKLAPRLFGAAQGVPSLGPNVRDLVSTGSLLLDWIQQLYNTVQTAMFITLLFIGLRLALRRTWLAIAVGVLVVAAATNNNPPPGGIAWIDAVFAVAAMSLITFAIFRFGMLATIVTMLVDNLPTATPYTGRLFHWSATPAVATTLLVIGIGAFGLYAGRAQSRT